MIHDLIVITGFIVVAAVLVAQTSLLACSDDYFKDHPMPPWLTTTLSYITLAGQWLAKLRAEYPKAALVAYGAIGLLVLLLLAKVLL